MKKILSFGLCVFFFLSIFVSVANAAPYDPWVETDKDVYNYGEDIRVHFYNAPGYPRDWICIVPSGSANTEGGDYQYIPAGMHEGEMIFKSPQPGEYEVRAYYGYNPLQYNVSARFRFAVAGEGYGSGYTNEYVDVPIVYGEPSYYAPPVAVTFAFDYFTYEIIGGFVEIVFWRGGHRYHHTPWYDHGTRITPDYIHKHPHHRIQNDDFFRHRERLDRDNHISHPDSYYGLKANLQKPAPGWQDRNNQQPRWAQKQGPKVGQRPQLEQKPFRKTQPWQQSSQQREQSQQRKLKQFQPTDPRSQKGQGESQQVRQSKQKTQREQRPAVQQQQRVQQSQQKSQWGHRESQPGRQSQSGGASSPHADGQEPSHEKHKESKGH